MKNWIEKFSNIFLLIIIAALLIQKIPQWYQMNQMNHQKIKPFLVSTLQQEIQTLPVENKKQILIFWATWCGPCSVELKRIQSAINDKELDPKSIHAISIGEPISTVRAAALNRNYQFPIYSDENQMSLQSVQVYGTPTIYFINEKGEIVDSLVGISPLLISRIKSFIND